MPDLTRIAGCHTLTDEHTYLLVGQGLKIVAAQIDTQTQSCTHSINKDMRALCRAVDRLVHESCIHRLVLGRNHDGSVIVFLAFQGKGFHRHFSANSLGEQFLQQLGRVVLMPLKHIGILPSSAHSTCLVIHGGQNGTCRCRSCFCMRHSIGKWISPSGNIVKQTIGKLQSAFKHRLNQAVVLLVQRHQKAAA